MGNKRKLDTFKRPLNPSEIASVAALIPGHVTRRQRRAMRPNQLVGTVVQDHYKPHAEQDNCGPRCADVHVKQDNA